MSPAGHGADLAGQVDSSGRQTDGPDVTSESDPPTEAQQRDVVVLPPVDVLGVQDDPVHQQVLVGDVRVVVQVKLARAHHQTVPGRGGGGISISLQFIMIELCSIKNDRKLQTEINIFGKK